MAHHCQEHWASQHTWQTMPAEAEGQRSAGSGTWASQSAQKGMAVGSVGIGAHGLFFVPEVDAWICHGAIVANVSKRPGLRALNT